MNQTFSVLFQIELAIAFVGGFMFGIIFILELIKDIGKGILRVIKWIDRKNHTRKYQLTKDELEKYRKIKSVPFYNAELEEFMQRFLHKGEDWSHISVHKETGKATLVWQKRTKSHEEAMELAKKKDIEIKKAIGIATDLIDKIVPNDIERIIKNKECEKCPAKETCKEGQKRIAKRNQPVKVADIKNGKPVAPKKQITKVAKVADKKQFERFGKVAVRNDHGQIIKWVSKTEINKKTAKKIVDIKKTVKR